MLLWFLRNIFLLFPLFIESLNNNLADKKNYGSLLKIYKWEIGQMLLLWKDNKVSGARN